MIQKAGQKEEKEDWKELIVQVSECQARFAVCVYIGGLDTDAFLSMKTSKCVECLLMACMGSILAGIEGKWSERREVSLCLSSWSSLPLLNPFSRRLNWGTQKNPNEKDT